jgi:hypothetical protein
MEQNKIASGIVATVTPPAKVVDMPAFAERQRLATYQTLPGLFQPKVTAVTRSVKELAI